MSVDEASELAPEVDLESLFAGLAPPGYDTKRVIVTSPKYLKALTDILSDTSHDVLHTYISWKVVQSFASAVKADALKPYERFRNELAGKASCQ
jgi:endothelin-converting enzyme